MEPTSLDDFPDLTFCFDSPNNDDTTSNDSFDSDWYWISDLDELEQTLQNFTNSLHFPSLSVNTETQIIYYDTNEEDLFQLKVPQKAQDQTLIEAPKKRKYNSTHRKKGLIRGFYKKVHRVSSLP